MSKAKQFLPDQSPWALLLWTTLAGLLFGLVGFGEIAEDYLRSARNSLHKHPASGDIVLIDVDDASLRRAMGKRSRELALQHFTVDRVVQETLALYGELIGNGGKG